MKKAYGSFPLIFLFVLGFVFVDGGAQLYAQLDLSPPANVSTTPGATITIPLNLNNPSATPIDAFGVTFLYPTGLLTFDRTENTGTLTQGWISIAGRENVSGQITIGGFHTTAATGSGVLINMLFHAKEGVSGRDSLKLRNFRDDLATATTTDGVFDIRTAVENRNSDLIPGQFDLSQNYPNPFNPETRIKFQLPRTSQVRIEVLNLLGQRIATLVDERWPAGDYELQWDGRDEQGQSAPSGIYLCRLQAGSFVETRKMMLVR